MANFGFSAPETGTDAELLAFVRQAIATILRTGQAYEIRGRTYTRANLADLYQLEMQLQTRVTRASTGRSVNYGRLRRG